MDQAPVRVFLVAAEPPLHAAVAAALARTGMQLLPSGSLHPPALILFDATLPEADAAETCRRAHEAGLPVLALAAGEDGAVRGLEAGADGYVTIPCTPQELALRVRVALRRAAAERQPITLGDLHIDPARHEATLAGRPLDLTATEFRLLACLAANAGRVVTWQALLKEAWLVDGSQGGREMVKTGVYRLRRKLEPDPAGPLPGSAGPHLILNVRSTGYLIADS